MTRWADSQAGFLQTDTSQHMCRLVTLSEVGPEAVLVSGHGIAAVFDDVVTLVRGASDGDLSLADWLRRASEAAAHQGLVFSLAPRSVEVTVPAVPCADGAACVLTVTARVRIEMVDGAVVPRRVGESLEDLRSDAVPIAERLATALAAGRTTAQLLDSWPSDEGVRHVFEAALSDHAAPFGLVVDQCRLAVAHPETQGRRKQAKLALLDSVKVARDHRQWQALVQAAGVAVLEDPAELIRGVHAAVPGRRWQLFDGATLWTVTVLRVEWARTGFLWSRRAHAVEVRIDGQPQGAQFRCRVGTETVSLDLGPIRLACCAELAGGQAGIRFV